MGRVKNIIIPYVIYPFDIMVSIAETDESLKKNLISRLPPSIIKDEINIVNLFDLSSNNKGRTVMFSGGQTILRMRDEIKKPEDHGNLSHEIFHAVDFLFQKINIELCNKSDEAYAYLISYLTKEIYARFRL